MKNLYRVRIGLVLLFSMMLVPGICNGDPENEGNWQNLVTNDTFDGFSFCFRDNGAENKGTFTLTNGVVVCEGRPSGYMYTQKSYSRFILEYQWKFKRPEDLTDDAAFKGNSGCLVHITEGRGIGIWPKCIEVQGMHQQAGLILPIPRDIPCPYTFDEAARAKSIQPVGEWNTTAIDVDGCNMKITLNGTLVSTVSGCELSEGAIGFQSEGAEIHFRNIRILEKQ